MFKFNVLWIYIVVLTAKITDSIRFRNSSIWMISVYHHVFSVEGRSTITVMHPFCSVKCVLLHLSASPFLLISIVPSLFLPCGHPFYLLSHDASNIHLAFRQLTISMQQVELELCKQRDLHFSLKKIVIYPLGYQHPSWMVSLLYYWNYHGWWQRTMWSKHLFVSCTSWWSRQASPRVFLKIPHAFPKRTSAVPQIWRLCHQQRTDAVGGGDAAGRSLLRSLVRLRRRLRPHRDGVGGGAMLPSRTRGSSA